MRANDYSCLGSRSTLLCVVLVGCVTGTQGVVGMGQQPAGQDVGRWMQQGMQAMSSGNFKAAVEAYSAVVKAEPGLAEGYFNLGLAEERNEQLEAARGSLEKAVALQPGLRGANLFLGIVDYRLNRLKEARQSLERETKIEPRNAKTWMWLGVCGLAEGDAKGAIAALERAYALDPKDVDILYHRGRAYLLMANESYEAMYRLNGNSVRVHQVLGEAFAKSYSTDAAIAEFSTAVRVAPHQPGVHEELADQYWIAGKVDEAIAAYRGELAVDPHAATALFKLGSLLVEHDQASEGVELLQAALREDASLADAHYYLASGLSALGRDAEAIEEYKAAVGADPEGDRAISGYYKLAQVYRKLHRTEEAQAALASFQHAKDAARQRQKEKAMQMARQRSELPVDDPERTAIAAGRAGTTSPERAP